MSAGIPQPPPIELRRDEFIKPIGYDYGNGAIYEEWYIKGVNRRRFWFGFIIGTIFYWAGSRIIINFL